MNEENKKILNAFNALNIGHEKLHALCGRFDDMREAWKLSEEALKEFGLGSQLASRIASDRAKTDIQKEWDKIDKNGTRAIAIWEDDYPPLLREIYAPPPLLYVKGDFFADGWNLSIVGARKPTSYGQDAAKKIVRELAPYQCNIVSGLAYGIDTTAHEAALANKLKTGAVLGCGVDVVYPESNKKLAEKIIAHGGFLMSEFPAGTPPLQHHFPQRNRIVAGLSVGTLVIEAKEKSGALITARLAMEEGREVFAIPGSVFSALSDGPNDLIQSGAKLVRSAKDIADELGIEFESDFLNNAPPNFSEEEMAIVSVLRDTPLSINAIILKTGISAQKIGSFLTIMELAGTIRKLTSGEFCINE